MISPSWGSSPTLAAGLNGHDNSLNFVRLVLATSVIFSHSFPVIGHSDPTNGLLTGLGGLAVNGFFIISGYLIAASAWRISFWSYLWRRALRILPAFWTVLVVVAFVIAPLFTLATQERWTFAGAAEHVGANALLKMNQWGVPETLLSVPYPKVWNGSLWTLFYEFIAYIVVGGIIAVPWVRRHAIAVFIVLTAGAIALYPLALGPLEITTNLYLNGLRLGTFFVTGSLFYTLRNHIHLNPGIGLASLAVFAGLYATNLSWFAGQLPLAYALFWLGATLKIGLGRTNDVSYGMYIYGFPMQQCTYLMIGSFGGWVVHSIVAITLTIPLAVASWFLVERPALQFKDVIAAKRRDPERTP